MPGEDGYLCSVWNSVDLTSGQLCSKHLCCSSHELKWEKAGDVRGGVGGREGEGGEGRGGWKG